MIEENAQNETGSVTESSDSEHNSSKSGNRKGSGSPAKGSSAISWVLGGIAIFMVFGCAITLIPTLWLTMRVNSTEHVSSVQPGQIVESAPTTVVLPSPRVIVATPEGGVDYETAVLNGIYI